MGPKKKLWWQLLAEEWAKEKEKSDDKEG